jgi:hypothetical protein
MKIYRFTLTFAGMEDSFHFSNPPSREHIRAAIKGNRAIASADFGEFYENLEIRLDQIPADEFERIHASSILCGIGGPIGEKHGDSYDSWSLNRYDVIKN